MSKSLIEDDTLFDGLTPLESMKRLLLLAKKGKSGPEAFREYATEQLAKRTAKQAAAAVAGHPLSEEARAQAAFQMTMEIITEAYISGGLSSLISHGYDVLESLQEQIDSLEGKSEEEQAATLKQNMHDKMVDKLDSVMSNLADKGADMDAVNDMIKGIAKEVGIDPSDIPDDVRKALRKRGRSGVGMAKLETGVMKISGPRDGTGMTPKQAEKIGEAIKQSIIAEASGNTGPIRVGGITVVRDDADAKKPLSKDDLNKLN